MGFFDNLNKNKQTHTEKLQGHHLPDKTHKEPTKNFTIPVETIPTNEEDWIFTKDTKTQIFSQRTNDGIIEYRLTRQAKSGKSIELCRILDKSDSDTLRRIVNEIDYVLDNPRELGGFNPYTLKQLVESSKNKLKDLSKKHNILFTPDVHEVLDHINITTQIALQPNVAINYKSFEKQLPKSIDISKLSFEELMAYGETLTSRINTLNTIKTPEDAYAHRYSLENFMRSKESTSMQGQILALLPNEEELSENNPNHLQNINKKQIIIDCAKVLETIPNEDGLLYSAYLKLEEDRILSQIQKDIHTFEQTISTNIKDKLQEFVETNSSMNEPEMELRKWQSQQIAIKSKAQEIQMKIEESKTKSETATHISNQTDPYETFTAVSRYMVDNILDNSIDNYTKTGLKTDLALKSFLTFHPEIPNSQQAIDYLHAKMSSCGQVTAIPKQSSLRKFIETTDYKIPELTESKNFLFVIANIEKNYVQKEYTPILLRYKEMLEQQKNIKTAQHEER